jgi:hypothetical protein
MRFLLINGLNECRCKLFPCFYQQSGGYINRNYITLNILTPISIFSQKKAYWGQYMKNNAVYCHLGRQRELNNDAITMIYIFKFKFDKLNPVVFYFLHYVYT